MTRRNSITFLVILVIFILCLAVVFPLDKGILGGRPLKLGLDLMGGLHIVYKADLSQVTAKEQGNVMKGVMAVLGNRINPLGVSEPLIQRQGEDRIIVELPGLSISDQDKDRLSRVALLEFAEQVTGDEPFKWENKYGKWKPATAVIEGKELTLTSRYFKNNTYVGTDNVGMLELNFEWDEVGTKLSKEITGRLIGKPLGIFEGDEALLGDDDNPIAPTVQAVIENRGRITGLSTKEAQKLSLQLNAGRLPVSLEVISEQKVSPSMGSDFVALALKAGIIGILLVMLFMIAYYRFSGFLASLALIFYALLCFAVFKLIPVTLTLSGLAGFIVSLGMAVDANVLIFERMKEEFRLGKTFGAVVDAGFNRAWLAIRDSNVTTIVACGIMYWLLGSGIIASAPVKGFALTLGIGVIISMFTAITVTRTLLRLFINTGMAQKPSLFTAFRGK